MTAQDTAQFAADLAQDETRLRRYEAMPFARLTPEQLQALLADSPVSARKIELCRRWLALIGEM